MSNLRGVFLSTFDTGIFQPVNCYIFFVQVYAVNSGHPSKFFLQQRFVKPKGIKRLMFALQLCVCVFIAWDYWSVINLKRRN